jgi:hypothetical protein
MVYEGPVVVNEREQGPDMKYYSATITSDVNVAVLVMAENSGTLYELRKGESHKVGVGGLNPIDAIEVFFRCQDDVIVLSPTRDTD